MSSVKISDLTAVPTLATTALLEIEQAGSSFKTTVQEALDFITVANVGAGATIFKDESPTNTFNLKSIIGGTNVTVDNNTDDITINAAGGGATTLDDLTDVTITTRAANQVLVVNPGNTLWVNSLLVNANIDATAAIAYSKLNLTGAVLNADLAGAIAYSKLVLTGAILNADLAGSIQLSKLENLTSGQIIVGSAGNVPTAVVMSGDIAIITSGATTIQVDAVDIPMLSASGTPDGTTFLRGDNTWSVPVGSASPLTTKGDIFGFTTVDARIPVGADDTVLIADATPALGVKYALVADANIAVHTSTKITITAKGQLNANIVYNDQANTYTGSNAQAFGTNFITFGADPGDSLDIRFSVDGGLAWESAAGDGQITYNAAGEFDIHSDDATTTLVRLRNAASVGLEMFAENIPSAGNAFTTQFAFAHDGLGVKFAYGAFNFGVSNVTDTTEAGFFRVKLAYSGEAASGPTHNVFEINKQDDFYAELLNNFNLRFQNLSETFIDFERSENLADDSVIGNIRFRAFDQPGVIENYARIQAIMVDDLVTAAEDGALNLDVMSAGTLTNFVKLDGEGVTVDILVDLDTGNNDILNIGTGTITLLAEELVPTSGDFLLAFEATSGAMRKVDIGNLPTGGGGESNTISSQGGGTIGLTAATPKSGIDLRVRSISNGDGMNATEAADLITLAVASTVVQTDQVNVYGDFLQTFKDNGIKINSPDDADGVTLVNSNQTTDRNLTIPVLTGDRNFIVTGEVNQITDTELTAGSFPKITGVGTLTVGVWNATDIVFANLQQIATDRLVGRDTAATGDMEELTVGGGVEFTGSGGIQTSALTGDVTKTAGGTATTIAVDAVDIAMLSATGTPDGTTFLRGDNTWSVPGGAQSPWLTDIDADGFDLRDLSNIEFRNTTLAPIASIRAIYATATQMIFNVPTSDSLDFRINNISEMEIDSTFVTFNGQAMTGIVSYRSNVVNVQLDGGTFGWEYEVDLGDKHNFKVNGTTELEISLSLVQLGVNTNLKIQANGATGYLEVGALTTPATPTNGLGRFYTKEVATITTPFFIGDDGTEIDLSAGGSGDMVLADVQTSTGKKTFAADATLAGFNLNDQVPSAPVEGDIWRNANNLEYEDDTATRIIATDVNTLTFSNKTLDNTTLFNDFFDITEQTSPVPPVSNTVRIFAKDVSGDTHIFQLNNTEAEIDLTLGGGIDGHVIEEEGTPLTQRANLNFIGGIITATDNTPDTDITVSGTKTEFDATLEDGTFAFINQANVFTENQRITKVDATVVFQLYLDQTTPADNVLIGGVDFRSDRTTGADVNFANIQVLTGDVTDATSSGVMKLRVRDDDSVEDYLVLDGELQTVQVVAKGDNVPTLSLFNQDTTPTNNMLLSEIQFFGPTSVASTRFEYGNIGFKATGVTDGAEESSFIISLTNAGSAPVTRFTLDGFDSGAAIFLVEDLVVQRNFATDPNVIFSLFGNQIVSPDDGTLLATFRIQGLSDSGVLDFVSITGVTGDVTGATSSGIMNLNIREDNALVAYLTLDGEVEQVTSFRRFVSQQTDAFAEIRMYDNQTTPADNTNIGQLRFFSDTDTVENTVFASFQAFTRDITNATSSGGFTIRVREDNANTTYIDVNGETELIQFLRPLEMLSNNITGLPGTFITVEATVVPISGDFILFSDTSDSGNLKKADASNFLGGGGEVNVTADVGGGAISIRGSTPKTGVALNLRTFDAANGIDVGVTSDIITFTVSSIVVLNNQDNTYTASKQRFVGSSSKSPISLAPLTADPSAQIEGDFWLLDTFEIRYRGGAQERELVEIDLAQTLTGKTIDADATGNVITNIGSSEIKSEIITGFGTVTGISGDFVLISDTSDSGNLKKVDVLDFLGGGAQTPWLTDIVADGFDLNDLSNLEFRNPSASVPAGTVFAIYVEGAGMVLNVAGGNNFAISEADIDLFTIDQNGATLTTPLSMDSGGVLADNGSVRFENDDGIFFRNNADTANIFLVGARANSTIETPSGLDVIGKFSAGFRKIRPDILTGPGSTIGNNAWLAPDGSAVLATGTATCVSVIAGDTFTINGITYTGVTGAKADNTEFSVDTGDTETATDLAASVNNDTRDSTTQFRVHVDASSSTNVVTITSDIAGTDGNVAMSETGGTIALSGATLTGGAGANQVYAKLLIFVESNTLGSEEGSIDINVAEGGAELTYIRLNDLSNNLIQLRRDIVMDELAEQNFSFQRDENLADDSVIGNLRWRSQDFDLALDTYAQITGIMVDDLTTALEDGAMNLDVLSAGTLTNFIKIEGESATIQFFKPLNMGTNNITNLPGTFITALTTVTGIAGDFIMISDGSDSGNLKKVNASDFLSAASQTPWTGNIDAAGFNLSDVGNVNFGTDQDIVGDAGGLTYDVANTEGHDFHINGTSTFNLLIARAEVPGGWALRWADDSDRRLLNTGFGFVFVVSAGDKFSFEVTANNEMAYISPTGSYFGLEKAAADTDDTTFGQTWVRNTTPQALMFTNEDGEDKRLDSDHTIQFIIDGGGSEIATGIHGDVEIPNDFVIERVTMLADQSGSIVVDIWEDVYANYPPTDADSITASAPPTITTDTDSQDTTLTGWTTTIIGGSTLRYNVDSVTTIQRVTISLWGYYV